MRYARPGGAPNLIRLLLCLAPWFGACGGAAGTTPSPAAPPTPLPTPLPTPTPRSTFTLNAPSDSSAYSTLLARLKVGSSIELEFTPMAINQVSGESFGHSIEFWLFADTSGTIALEERGELNSALSFVWSERTTEWVVSSYTNGTGYAYSSRRVRLPFGDPRTMLIHRTSDGRAEFFLDGDRILDLVNPESSELLYARAFGAAVEVSFVPGVFGSSPQTRSSFSPGSFPSPKPPKP